MINKAILMGMVLAAGCMAGEAEVKLPTPAPATESSRTVQVNERSVTPVATSVLETTLLVVPEGEKMVNFFGGDKASWEIRSTDVASRYLAIKPKLAGARTSLQIITDHGNSYSFTVSEVSGTGRAYDVKIFMEGDTSMKDNIQKPAVWIQASDVDKYKREADEAKAAQQASAAKTAETVQADEEKFRSHYPATLRYDYHWDRKIGDRLNVQQIFRDEKFTYIVANPQEAPVLFEVKDKHPSLINFEFANGLYIVGKVVNQGYLQVGKVKMDFNRVAN